MSALTSVCKIKLPVVITRKHHHQCIPSSILLRGHWWVLVAVGPLFNAYRLIDDAMACGTGAWAMLGGTYSAYKDFQQSSGKTKPINMEHFRKQWVVGCLILTSYIYNSHKRGNVFAKLYHLKQKFSWLCSWLVNGKMGVRFKSPSLRNKKKKRSAIITEEWRDFVMRGDWPPRTAPHPSEMVFLQPDLSAFLVTDSTGPRAGINMPKRIESSHKYEL